MATLNDEEVEALMSAIHEGQVEATSYNRARGAVVPFDLTSQDRIIRGELPTLDAINERAAGLFGTGLAGRTRLDLRVVSAAAVSMKFADLTPLLVPPATICVLSVEPGHDQALLVLEAGLADTLLAAAMGDRKPKAEELPPGVRRELTTIERQVLRRLIHMLAEGLADAWHDIHPFRLQVMRFESDPRLCMVAPPNDVALLTPFELSGAINGRMQLAIPYSAVEQARKKLSAPPRSGAASDGRFLRQLEDELHRVNVEVSALLGRTSLRLERLLGLEVGDVLTLSHGEDDALPVLVQGREKMKGLPLSTGATLSVRLTEFIPPESLVISRPETTPEPTAEPTPDPFAETA
jgi:flagellar motor switch protein FliM